MCVNDLVVQGAEPLFFLDYFATGSLSVDAARTVIAGIAEGCRQAGCALVGGETAEMPGMYAAGDYDLAGFAVGAAERGALLPRDVAPGDALLGLASDGVHSNGFSLVRRVVAASGLAWTAPAPFAADRSLGQALMTPTRIYVPALLALHRAGLLKAAAHITGGGLPGNLPRVLPDGCVAALDGNAWTAPPVFGWLAQAGGIAADEMLRVFNCGLGMVLVVSDADAALSLLHEAGEQAWTIGSIEAGTGPAQVRMTAHAGVGGVKRRTAVLISGRGSNMVALLEAARDPDYPAEIALVCPTGPMRRACAWRHEAGVPTLAIDHRPFGKDRAAHERRIDAALRDAGVTVVCLAGYMRLLTPFLVGAWRGRMLNIHPSLLPAFPGPAHPRTGAGGRREAAWLHGAPGDRDDG